jgi:hypothetical protein
MSTHVRDDSAVQSPGPAGFARRAAAIAGLGLRTAAAVAGVLFAAGAASARPGAGELAARSSASVSISVSVRPRFDVGQDAERHAADPAGITVRSNFGDRFSVRQERDAPLAPTGMLRAAVFIIVPD